MIGGARLHSHSRTTAQHALSSGESEVMALSELLKEAKLMQYNLEFVGCGRLPITLHTDADVARNFVHKRGVGKMKHIDVRLCWLQEEMTDNTFKCKRVDRAVNAADMLTKTPNKQELDKFLPMMGLWPLGVARGACELVKSALRSVPAVQVAAGILAMMPKGAEAAGGMELLPPVGEDISYFFFVVLLAVLCFTALAAACLCGYACGRCQAKIEYIREPVYVEKPIYIERPADTTEAKTEDYIQDPPRQRKLEAEIVYLSPKGDCFHTYKECNGLRGVSPSGLTSKRACSFCGGGPGRKKGTEVPQHDRV